MKSPDEIEQIKSRLLLIRLILTPLLGVLLFILLINIVPIGGALLLSLIGAGVSYVTLSLMLNKWAGL